MKPIQTLILSSNPNQKNKIILKKDYELSSTYHVFIDTEHEAEVVRFANGWTVRPRVNSLLTKEDCELILETVKSQENNS